MAQHRSKSILLALALTVGFVAPANAFPSYQTPRVSHDSQGIQAQADSIIRIIGDDLNQVSKVLVDGVETSFMVSTKNKMTIRIPIGASPGDTEIQLVTKNNELTSFPIEIVTAEIPENSKVTIGTFLGYVAVYTKNLQGQKLSIQVGSKLRAVNNFDKTFTANLTKVGKNTLVEVKVFVAGQLMQTTMVLVR